MTTSIYDILEVSPAATLREIKKAYAAKIKACDQETEAERFQNLRQAYEWACQIAAEASASNEHAPCTPHPLHEQELIVAAETPGDAIRLQPLAQPHAESDHGDSAPHSAQEAFTPDPAHDALHAFVLAIEQNPDRAPKDLLSEYLRSEALISIETRERFEQRLMEWIFEADAKIPLLDAAIELFSWANTNRHLRDYRFDLVHRIQSHLECIALLYLNSKDKDAVETALFYAGMGHAQSVQVWRMQFPRFKLVQLASAWGRVYPLYARELSERFGAAVDYINYQVHERQDEIEAEAKLDQLNAARGNAMRYWFPMLIGILVACSGQISAFLTPPSTAKPSASYSETEHLRLLQAAEKEECPYSADDLARMSQSKEGLSLAMDNCPAHLLLRIRPLL